MDRRLRDKIFASIGAVAADPSQCLKIGEDLASVIGADRNALVLQISRFIDEAAKAHAKGSYPEPNGELIRSVFSEDQ